jgi:hypothetical protein
VGLATLSDWQHGRARPQRPNSLRAVDALEEILELPRKTLSGLIATGASSWQGVDEHSGAVGELLDALPRGHEWDLDVINAETTIVIGPDRRRSAIRIRRLVRARRDGNVLVAEMLFGQSLRIGETWLFEYAVHQPAASTDFAHGFRRQERNFLLEVRFHPDALPQVVYGYYRADLYGDRQRVTELTLDNHHTVHLTAAGMAAGVIGINWRWPQGG